MEANYKRMITKLESDLNMKSGIFNDMTGQLKQLQEQNMQLSTDVEMSQEKAEKANGELL